MPAEATLARTEILWLHRAVFVQRFIARVLTLEPILTPHRKRGVAFGRPDQPEGTGIHAQSLFEREGRIVSGGFA